MSQDVVILGGLGPRLGSSAGAFAPSPRRYGLAAICGNGGHGASVAVERVG